MPIKANLFALLLYDQLNGVPDELGELLGRLKVKGPPVVLGCDINFVCHQVGGVATHNKLTNRRISTQT